MCGIAGFIDFRKQSTTDDLAKMISSLQHRGPDGENTVLFDTEYAGIGLGHRRLAIIDLSENGRQPMEYKGYMITFNGEIYNYKEIKVLLEASGHTFHTSSDTEVMLHAYEEWGEECLQRFIGMFAFVLYNPYRKIIFCVRDRAGVKPFFYYRHEGLFLFASELKAFHRYPRFEKKISQKAVMAFMQYGNIPAPHCIFENCFKLRPGHFLKLDLVSGNAEEKQYWSVYDAYNQPKLDIGIEEAIDETEKVLEQAFQYRMVADVPVGIFLSGGYDSSCLTALLQKDRSQKLKTYTIGVPDIGLNEAPYAKDIAAHLGTDHTEITCTEKEALDLIDQLPFYYDEPFADSSAIPTMLVSKMARKEVTVALSADAGDEVFAGYNRYDFLLKYRKKLHQVPGIARQFTAGLMDLIPSQNIPVLKNKYNFHNRYEKLKGILRDPSEKNIMLSLSQQYTDEQLKQVFTYNPEQIRTAYTSTALKKEFYTPLAYMMAIDYQTYLPDDILQKVDRATMSASLEGREPFLDHHVIEWAARLPDSYKYRDGEKKYILKKIVHRYIPQTLLDRPKMGFAIPVGSWLTGVLKGHLDTYLDEEKIRKQGIFEWEFIHRLKKEFLGGKKEYDQKVWYVLSFQMWYEKWM